MRRSALLVCLLLNVPILAAPGRVLVNHSSSLPLGAYLLRSGLPRRGLPVAYCLPLAFTHFGLRRGYLRPGRCPAGTQPILKYLAALPGDCVDVDSRGVVRFDRFGGSARALPSDSRGRPIWAYPPGRYRVPPGSVWLVGTHPRSWDSRYYGPVPAHGVLGGLVGPVEPLVVIP